MKINLTEQTWQIAEKFVSLLDPKPTSLISVVKILLADGNAQCSPTSLSAVERLMLSDVFRLPFDSMLQTYAEILEVKNITSLKDFRANDIAGMLLAIYIYGKLKVIVKPEDLAYILPRLSLECDIGAALGLSLPGLNCLTTTIQTLGRFFALGLLYVEDQKLYTEYRRVLRSNRFRSDHSFELERFQCTLEQIFSACGLALGLNSTSLDGYVTSALYDLNDSPPSLSEYRFWIQRLWIESLIDQGSIPQIEHRLDFYPETSLAPKLELLLKSLISNQQGFSVWLEKG